MITRISSGWCYTPYGREKSSPTGFVVLQAETGPAICIKSENIVSCIMFSKYKEILFFTATNLKWLPLLEDEKSKEIISSTLQYMAQNNRCKIYAFVIMPNHIHLLLDLITDDKTSFQRSFMKYTAQQCLFYFKEVKPQMLKDLESTQVDRKYQFWERRPYWTNIASEETMFQKMAYIHENPVSSTKTDCLRPENYHWSSARSYKDGISYFDFLSLIS